MGGIIRGFVAGAGKGMADVSQMLLADKLNKERDEANYLRDREMNKDKQVYGTAEREAGQKFSAGQREAEQKHQSSETKKKLAADKENTLVSAGAKGAEKTTDYTKKVNEIMQDMGVSRKVATIVADKGVTQTINNSDGTQTLMSLDLESGVWKKESTVVPTGRGSNKSSAQKFDDTTGAVEPFQMSGTGDGIIGSKMDNKPANKMLSADDKGQPVETPKPGDTIMKNGKIYTFGTDGKFHSSK
jgi:hypothetical protein